MSASLDSVKDMVYRVGEFEVDTSKGCLRHSDGEIHLRQKSFQVLVFLLEQRERLVSCDKLHDRVWADAAVTPDTLVQSIVEIRKALGDDPQAPQFIKTIPKVGYRFVGPVAVADGTEDRLGGRRQTRSRWVTPLPLVGIALVLAGLVWWQAVGRQENRTGFLTGTENRRPVLVSFFQNLSGDPELDWMEHGLADMLITGLSRAEDLSVFSRERLDTLLERRGADAVENESLATALELGRSAGAEVVVVGSFSRLGESIRVGR